MINEQDEKFIAELFARLPRKSVFSARKEQVWLRIQNELRDARIAVENAGAKGSIFLRRPFSRLAVGSLIVILAVGIGGAAYASQSSLPGETLYTVKLATEKVQVALATNDAKKVEVLSNHAKNRLEEVAKLVENNETSEIVNQTLTALKTTTDTVVAVSSQKPELADQVADLAAAEEQALSDVVPQAEGEVKQAVEEALTVSRESFSKLKNTEENVEPEVKGVETTTSTSATVGVKKPSAKPQTATITPPEGLIQSPIQINDVIDAISGDSLPPLEP